MKKLFALSLLGIFFVSCSSDDDGGGGAPLATTPDAKVEHDDSSFGIYKGIFIGSSGVVFINVNNEDGISSKIVIDGATHNFTTTETATDGDPISGLTFTSGAMSFDFNCDSDGDNAYITNIDLPGHPNAEMMVIKEFSDIQVKCYRGTYNGDDSGTFNLIITQDGWVDGMIRPNGETESTFLTGSVEDNDISGSFSGGVFVGTVNGNNASGQWSNMFEENGNWSGQRKL